MRNGRLAEQGHTRVYWRHEEKQHRSLVNFSGTSSLRPKGHWVNVAAFSTSDNMCGFEQHLRWHFVINWPLSHCRLKILFGSAHVSDSGRPSFLACSRDTNLVPFYFSENCVNCWPEFQVLGPLTVLFLLWTHLSSGLPSSSWSVSPFSASCPITPSSHTSTSSIGPSFF